MRAGLWDRQGANIASRCKEIFGVEVVSPLKAVCFPINCQNLAKYSYLDQGLFSQKSQQLFGSGIKYSYQIIKNKSAGPR